MRCRAPIWLPRSPLFRGNVRYPLLSTSTLVRPYHGANEPGSLEAKAQQPGQGEARPSLPERTKLDRENLLKEFGLETVPGTANQGTGAKVDNMGQLQITDTSLSERPHKTALLLYRAPVSLTERDFLRILSPGKHIEGWKSHGGLEQSWYCHRRYSIYISKVNMKLTLYANSNSSSQSQDTGANKRLAFIVLESCGGGGVPTQGTQTARVTP